jgi:hypothetical protein
MDPFLKRLSRIVISKEKQDFILGINGLFCSVDT